MQKKKKSVHLLLHKFLMGAMHNNTFLINQADILITKMNCSLVGGVFS